MLGTEEWESWRREPSSEAVAMLPEALMSHQAGRFGGILQVLVLRGAQRMMPWTLRVQGHSAERKVSVCAEERKRQNWKQAGGSRTSLSLSLAVGTPV